MSTLREIAEAVAKETGVSVDDLLSRSQKRVIARARWHIFGRLAASGWTTAQIGRHWGYDHTSVWYGLHKIGVRVRRCPPVMPNLTDADDARRAEVIRQYWAARGVDVKLRVDRGWDAKRRESVPIIRSSGIPTSGAHDV